MATPMGMRHPYYFKVCALKTVIHRLNGTRTGSLYTQNIQAIDN